MFSSHFIEENKWYVMRSGLNAEVVDFAQGHGFPYASLFMNCSILWTMCWMIWEP